METKDQKRLRLTKTVKDNYCFVINLEYQKGQSINTPESHVLLNLLCLQPPVRPPEVPYLRRASPLNKRLGVIYPSELLVLDSQCYFRLCSNLSCFFFFIGLLWKPTSKGLDAHQEWKLPFVTSSMIIYENKDLGRLMVYLLITYLQEIISFATDSFLSTPHPQGKKMD